MISYTRGVLLEVRDLSHSGGDGGLRGVDFDLRAGRIMGVVGEGRGLLLDHILGYALPQKGAIRFLGEPLRRGDERIAPMTDRLFYPPEMTLLRLERFLRGLYASFRRERYFELLDRFVLSPAAKAAQLDRGARCKLTLAVALSTEAELLVFRDGLDDLDQPIEEELRELLLEFVAEGGSVLLSSAKLSNVEHFIDDLTVLHHGKQLFSEACDEFAREFALLRCPAEALPTLGTLELVGLTVRDRVCEALVHRVEIKGRIGAPGVTLAPPTTEDVWRLSLAHEKNLEEGKS